MDCRTSAILFASLMLVLVATWRTEAVDCRRFVFAPKCRGVSAKRAQLSSYPLREYGGNFAAPRPKLPAADGSDEKQADYVDTLPFPDEYLRSLLRKYWSSRAAMSTDGAEA